MHSSRPAVVAIGYDRPAALERLLGSLSRGRYPDGAPLIISLDCSGVQAVADVAAAFDWPFGPKRILKHQTRLGLRDHILACGDLSQEYGGVILFEDDIVAAPHFYDWVLQAFAAYGDDARIGGIALYGYQLNEFNNLDFEPLADGSDVYFLQVAASWGQAWTADQWLRFRAWYAAAKDQPIRSSDGVPRQLEAWKASSWKKYFIKYLVRNDRFFVYPRAALSTNTARPGTHTKRAVSIYQTPLDTTPRAWRLPELDVSGALYDAFYEPRPETIARHRPEFADVEFDVDLFGSKPSEVLRRSMLLSSRPCREPIRRFGLLTAAPPAASVVQGAAGNFFSLGPRKAFGSMTPARRWSLINATQAGEAANKFMFQLLKPVQTEMHIAMARRSSQARHG